MQICSSDRSYEGKDHFSYEVNLFWFFFYFMPSERFQRNQLIFVAFFFLFILSLFEQKDYIKYFELFHCFAFFSYLTVLVKLESKIRREKSIKWKYYCDLSFSYFRCIQMICKIEWMLLFSFSFVFSDIFLWINFHFIFRWTHYTLFIHAIPNYPMNQWILWFYNRFVLTMRNRMQSFRNIQINWVSE